MITQLKWLLISLIVVSKASAQVVLPIDPARTWRILQTEHFEIIYEAHQKELAEKYAAEAERAHTLLQPLLNTSVPSRVPVLIADITDIPNGSATAIPRSQIELYPVLPAVTDSTSEYANWAQEIIVHEYTHILNFEPTSGFVKILRTLFGSIVKPGGLLPRWYTEGLAVEMESRFTSMGRGRSHYYSALVRSMIEDKTWGTETIDRINSTQIPTWPRGQRPYSLGFFLMHELGELKPTEPSTANESVYSVLNNRYGGRFPWFINGPVEELFGKDYQGLLDTTYTNVGQRATKHLEILKSGGAKNGTPLKQDSYFVIGSRISPDGLKLAAIVSQIDEAASIRIWKRENPQTSFTMSEFPKPLISAKDVHQLSWRSDSRYLVYDRSDTRNHFNTYNELYEVDTENGDEKQLTFNLRAQQPCVLPDASLVFVMAKANGTDLYSASAQGENPKLLYSPPSGNRLSSPRPYLSGVIYSHRDNDGKEWIEWIDLKDSKVTKLTSSEKPGDISVFPIPDPKNKKQFYFVGSQSGVMNLYLKTEQGVQSITNVTTQLISPEVDITANEAIYSRLTGNGFFIESSKLAKTDQPPAKIDDLIKFPESKTVEAPSVAAEEQSYLGLKYLWPQYWIPFIYFVPDGALFSASTSGSDPLRHHAYGLDVGYDTRAKEPREEFLYSNFSFPFSINFQAANDYIYFAGANLTQHFTYANLNTQHFLFSDSNKWLFGPQVTYQMVEQTGTSLTTQFGPGLNFLYNNITPARDYQISPESGQSFFVDYSYFLEGSWGNTTFPRFRARATQFLSGRPLPKRHVVYLKAATYVAPDRLSVFKAGQQAGGEYFFSMVPSTYVVRGYPVGEFVGTTLFTGTFEYRFPLTYIYGGPGTAPVFTNKWSGVLLADAITLKGGYYDSTTTPAKLESTKLGNYFMGTGFEVRADMSVFYSIPIQFKAGIYYGATEHALGGMSFFLGFGLL